MLCFGAFQVSRTTPIAVSVGFVFTALSIFLPDAAMSAEGEIELSSAAALEHSLAVTEQGTSEASPPSIREILADVRAAARALSPETIERRDARALAENIQRVIDTIKATHDPEPGSKLEGMLAQFLYGRLLLQYGDGGEGLAHIRFVLDEYAVSLSKLARPEA